MSSRILVTGAAGFIGYHLAERLLAEGHEVVGVDDFNAYYDVSLKEARAARLSVHDRFTLARVDLAEQGDTERLFRAVDPTVVVHLAAQAGVRYSLSNPHAYGRSNLTGFLNILEGCRAQRTTHLVYASSSSVYGANAKTPFAVEDRADHPVSLYAATKRANELMAHTYSHLYGLPMTGLRFFTVYGPWGRPDMAYYSFTKRILAGEPIDVYNDGRLQRDFTYVDDIVEGIVRLLPLPPALQGPPGAAVAHELHNIGNSSPVELMTFIRTLEDAIGRRAALVMRPMQPGDVPATFADVRALESKIGFRPATKLADGLSKFVAWYRAYHGA